MNDIQLAILGSKKAAKRLTDVEIMIPCPFCGRTIDRQVEESLRALNEFDPGQWCYIHFCRDMDDPDQQKYVAVINVYGQSKAEVIQLWNTRPSILSEETLAELEERNAHD